MLKFDKNYTMNNKHLKWHRSVIDGQNMATITINTKQGKLKGAKTETENGNSYYEFLCVPYAKPPIGDLRFRNPQPPDNWDGERDATSVNESYISYQFDLIKRKLIGSDDCLYLNIYTPILPTKQTCLLPVMFFIHGGGFVYSNGILKSELGPDYLIDNNVVVITINYRLGALGFLSLGISEVAGNMGLKDQIQALKWVQENIKNFGGDNRNVTIFGISAGSASVEYLILSPLTKNLFHKAIMQSGSSLNHWAINYEPQKTVEQLLHEMEYKGSPQDVREVYEFLLNAPVCKLVESSFKVIEKGTPNRLSLGFVVTIEKDFGDGEAVITSNPYKLLKTGQYNKIPVIKGFCNKEGYLTCHTKPDAMQKLLAEKNMVSHWAYQMEDSDAKQFKERLSVAYTENVTSHDELDKVGVDFFGDLDFVAGIWLSGKIMANQGVPVYFYNLCYGGNINFFKHYFSVNREGSSHGDDLAYIFKHPITKFAKEKDVEIRTNMTKMWTNFAKTSDPRSGNEAVIPWIKYTKSSPVYLRIDEDTTIVKTNYEPKKMEIFKEIYDKYEK